MIKKYKPKTLPTPTPVPQFISAQPESIQPDLKTLIKIMQEESGHKPAMWGPSIIGFGSYHYVYKSGHSGDAPRIGLSPRKQNLTLYVLPYAEEDRKKVQTLLDKLGPHTTSKICLYIKKLSDINLKVLRTIIKRAVADMKKLYTQSK